MEDQILTKLNEINSQLQALRQEIESLKLSILYIKQAPLPQDPNACIDGFGHDYPSPWFGTIPPRCKKCGKESTYTIISYRKSGTGDAPDFNLFGGNMMYTNINTTQYVIDNGK